MTAINHYDIPYSRVTAYEDPVLPFICFHVALVHSTSFIKQRPNSQPWFVSECAAAIAHQNHFFHLFNEDRCDEKRLNSRLHKATVEEF